LIESQRQVIADYNHSTNYFVQSSSYIVKMDLLRLKSPFNAQIATKVSYKYINYMSTPSNSTVVVSSS